MGTLWLKYVKVNIRAHSSATFTNLRVTTVFYLSGGVAGFGAYLGRQWTMVLNCNRTISHGMIPFYTSPITPDRGPFRPCGYSKQSRGKENDKGLIFLF